MVTVIDRSTKLKEILNYNEKKVASGVAVCLVSSSFPKELSGLTFTHKLNRLLNKAALRPTVENPGVHISINIDPSEIFPREKLLRIATEYMERIGFADQPYLVYQHDDSAPHLHIVTTSIDENGPPVETSNIGRGKSESIRKALEIKHGLVIAHDAEKSALFQPAAVNLQEVVYGKTISRAAIAKVLNAALKQRGR